MPEPPGYVQEVPTGPGPIQGVGTSVAAFVGHVHGGVDAAPTTLHSAGDFERAFGGLDSAIGFAVSQFFVNGGSQAIAVPVGTPASREALLAALAKAPGDFNLLCIPETFDLSDDDAVDVANAALALCRERRAFYLVDAPRTHTLHTIANWADRLDASSHGAVYFPPLLVRVAGPAGFVQHAVGPAAAVAGVFARTDQQRGVWKSPAGLGASLRGIDAPAALLTDAQNGVLNPRRINAIRRFPSGLVVWGARTLRGADAMADDYKYVPVRRLSLFLQQSIERGTQWATFEPNDEPLWSRLRLQVSTFMHGLFRQGAFQGTTPREAYFIRCDAATTMADDILHGRLNLHIGFAPQKPAEFVVFSIQHQLAPQ